MAQTRGEGNGGKVWGTINKSSALSVGLVLTLLAVVGTGSYWTGWRTRGTDSIEDVVDRHIQLGGHDRWKRG